MNTRGRLALGLVTVLALLAASSIYEPRAAAATPTFSGNAFGWSPSTPKSYLRGHWTFTDTWSGHSIRTSFQGSDGHLVEYLDNKPIWAAPSTPNASTIDFQGSDGNVVIRDSSGKALFAFGAIWGTYRPQDSFRSVTIEPFLCNGPSERMGGIVTHTDGSWDAVPQLEPAHGPGC